MELRTAFEPLHDNHRWIVVCAVALILIGVGTLTSLNLIGVIAIWMGVLLLQFAVNLRHYMSAEDDVDAMRAIDGLRRMFRVGGITFAIMVGLALIVTFTFVIPSLLGWIDTGGQWRWTWERC